MGGACDACSGSSDGKPPITINTSPKTRKKRKKQAKGRKNKQIKQNKKKEIIHLEDINDTVRSSTHYISDLVDADAAKRTNDDHYASDATESSEGFDGPP